MSEQGARPAHDAEAALTEILGILERLRELALESSDDATSQRRRFALDAEAALLTVELDLVAGVLSPDNP